MEGDHLMKAEKIKAEKNEKMEKSEKIEKIDTTLKELLIGIAATGILFQLTIVWLVKDKLSYSAGLWLGVLLAAFLAWHMWRTLDEALNLGAAGAEKTMRKQSLLRYVVVVAVLAVLMCTDIANPLAAFLGVMTLKAAAYLQPMTHKAILRLRR